MVTAATDRMAPNSATLRDFGTEFYGNILVEWIELNRMFGNGDWQPWNWSQLFA